MIIENKKTRFTENDLENFEIRLYSDDDLDQKEWHIKNRYTKQSKIVIALLLLLDLVSKDLYTRLFFGIPLFIIGFILYCLRQFNIKYIRSHDKYIEVRIIEKLDVVQNKFYPIVGRDIISDYQAVCYISRADYVKSDIGNIIKVDINKWGTLF